MMQGIVWFREDLRVTDNLALSHAANDCLDGLIGLYIVDRAFWATHHMAEKRIAFLQEGLTTLKHALTSLNIPLIVLVKDNTFSIQSLIIELMEQFKIEKLYFNKQYEINELKRDIQIINYLKTKNITVHTFDDAVILKPGSVKTQQGDSFKVFTAFKKRWLDIFNQSSVKLLPKIKSQQKLNIKSSTIPSFNINENISIKPWVAGELVAKKMLQGFINKNLFNYDKQRDYPAKHATSLLSPYLSTGMISPRLCFIKALLANENELHSGNKGALTWLNELIWRDFYKHILVATPRVSMNRAYQLSTEKLPWQFNKKQLLAWQQGNTGYPIIDAAMRQLNTIGWMHNRLRMITAMFFSKNMLFDWRIGENYFIKNLIDGDLAANNGGWQWSASTGTDAAPYFRIFNPITQSEGFDPDGDFIRQYCPELKTLDNWAIHDPYGRAPLLVQKINYPRPFVNLKESRQRALDAYKSLKT